MSYCETWEPSHVQKPEILELCSQKLLGFRNLLEMKSDGLKLHQVSSFTEVQVVQMKSLHVSINLRSSFCMPSSGLSV
jgi:hypothetical protein